MSDGEKLFRAAGAGDDAKVKRLLKAKADVNFGCSRKGWSGDGKSFTVTGVTALQAACGRGHLGVARLLLKAKASVDHRDSMGTCALYHACESNEAACARLLIKEANATVDIRDNTGCTPLYHACEDGNVECVPNGERLRLRDSVWGE